MKNNEQPKKWLNEFYEIALDTAQMYSFWNTLNEICMQDVNISENNEAQETVEEKKIKEPREYKIYKLDINGIAPIKWDFIKAKKKIESIPRLKAQIWNDFNIENILPLIIKESRMDNSQVSSTWARWYLQITDIALQDINSRYELQELHLNRENAVDNLIIWFLYYWKRNMEIIEAWLNKIWKDKIFSKTDKNELNILSYNIWAQRTLDLLCKSNAKNLNEFKRYLWRYLWCSWQAETKLDPYYKVRYKDYLNWKTSFNTREKQKVAEWIRYLEIINWLNSYLGQETMVTIIWTINCANKTLYSQVIDLRKKKVFKENANVNAICKVILETNWYKETEIPGWVDLLLFKDALKIFLN